MSERRGRRLRLSGAAVVGAAVLAGCWPAVAWQQPEILVPSPAETAAALLLLVESGELAAQLWTTLSRAAVGVAIGIAAGALWGLASASRRWIDEAGRPLRGLLLGLPPVIPAVLGTVWLGDAGAVAVLVVVVVTVPTAKVTVAEAARAIDADLLEMARVYRLPPAARLRHLQLPALVPALRSAASLCGAGGLRVAIMAELLVAPDGVGAAVAQARGNLATAEVFAWALVAVAAALVTDWLVARPARRGAASRAAEPVGAR
ncbi:ABC transporter permease [Saccharopolyspora erythraea]|uniref:ABC sulfonate transport system, permease protein n=1 Tax=Saccharopolyspora erythraea (strain ATCC 11635 / DSM 40517 / JCM 4748 / NBRC 13426 / NCIMB 8594 / NRRL 2338) TaxID=405948 RepID=A4FAB6_SACEN|nr:ABC transporter permease subunit [Saccharopolyspora erythraea]EQD86438.1 sulfonate ABC transporter permease [Saccharopolyspora erythraea D]QRK91496.1 ABC transporter permease subunit [Saccharopolyspora erythraea]CAM00991.1 ABC sulfonate transport system, permease protein [Saccharopolyspora erythraea NRRL 2338]